MSDHMGLKTMYTACALTLLSGCANLSRVQIIDLAHQSGFVKEIYQFDRFPITSLAKNNAPAEPTITVYIEGDGYAYISKSRPSSNPTPKTPVGLYLAQKDDGANIVYLGRPCQYGSAQDFKNKCDRKYWTTHRFAQDVVLAYDNVLDQLKVHNSAARFNLIGFSGGANIAGLLASSRNDVDTLITVAGNVDNEFFTRFHKVSAMPYSLNMADNAQTLSAVPQIHYIGESDRFVPIDIYRSYRAKLSSLSCTRMQIVEHTTHLERWAEAWPQLLSQKPVCQ